MLPAEWDYWKNLREDMPRYREEKEKTADAVVAALEQRFPGSAAQVEVRDVATPVTFNRYTGVWKGIFEGWLPPVNSFFMRMDKTLPGLDGFYIIGQWVEPGGGVPSGVISGRNVAQIICKREGKKFTTSVA
jgi:phytoene dehydrogenase-like protein